ncbi:ABC transporter substrate-binding protein [Microbacterium phosphatis]|uniref:ABC transporter substrate-binding protein n=1 Tax=Microbacterium phosphatis TaxID=3140248 RepID=UPI003140175A
MRLRPVIPVLLAAAVLALTACAPSSAAPAAGGASAEGAGAIRLGQLTSYSTFAIARDLGLGAELPDGTAVEWVTGLPAFAPALEAAQAGAIDASSGGGTNFFTALLSGADIRAIGVEAGSSDQSSGIVATGASGITGIEGLAGHSIAVNQGGTGHYLALRALDRAGIDPSEVTLEFLPPADAVAAFQAGAVDAIAIWDQYFSTASQQPGARVVATAGDLDSRNLSFHWVTGAFADAHPDQVQALIAGLEEVSDQTSEDPTLVTDFYRELGAGEDVLSDIAQWPPFVFEPITPERIAEFTAHGEDLVRYGLIDELPDVSGAFVVAD